MRRLLTVLALGAFLAAPLSAVDINCDLTNLGPATAYDAADDLLGIEFQVGLHPGRIFGRRGLARLSLRTGAAGTACMQRG